MLLNAAHGEEPLVAGELGLDDQTQGRPGQQGARACADLGLYLYKTQFGLTTVKHGQQGARACADLCVPGLYLNETQFGWWQPSHPTGMSSQDYIYMKLAVVGISKTSTCP